MREETRESLKGWAVDLAVITVIGVFLAVLGPFGNFFNGPLWQRLPYWVGMAWSGALVYGGALRLILAQGWSRPRVWLALTVLVVVATVPFALFSNWVASSIWPILRRAPGLSPLVWYGEGLITAGPQVALFYLLHQRRAAARAKAAGRAAAPGALLGVRPADVLCLSMEDHYVRVHTATGSSLVLATMAQAIAALGGIAGLQVHRSWWVAEKAVAGAVAEGRNVRLRLSNGVVAPVARTSVAAVRAAGWLER